eukprot:CAMPEP_0119357114 /NCGR_PEP_ID=MMETSP1334-20130426/5566_1 /TAXON_ID=127549 /ORGANISM="Calcidiscus leptoporus, Strain RCC1130" /LENGTH=889 /DNA_ID=CAMNT_0007371295 /DNA_START=176 /DNA_END=2845 /DNA_ORIENTATION=+
MPPNPMLSAYLDEAARRKFVDSMMEVVVQQGEVIMRQGDKGNNFYLVKEGLLEVEVKEEDGSVKKNKIVAGGGCGELALLTGQPRAATITAISKEVKLLMVNRKAFNATIGGLIAKKRSVWNPFLGRISLFSQDLNEYERGLIADVLRPVVFKPGEVICKEGELATSPLFYMIREGTVSSRAAAESKEVALGAGDYFGEAEILQKRANLATCTAKDHVVCATISSDHFVKLVPLHALIKDGKNQAFALSQGGASGAKQMRGRRFGESAEVTTAHQRKTPKAVVAKSSEALTRILTAVKRNAIFSRLNDAQLKMVQQAMMEHHVPAGSNVISQGEKGNHFYVVDAGDLDAYVKSPGQQSASHVMSFGAGDSFGELALMYNCPRTASITARTDVVLWSLDRVSFRSIVLEANTKKATMYDSFLSNVQLLEPLTKNQRSRMVDALEEVSYKSGERIIQEGEAGTHFFILVEGEVLITKGGAELARRGRGDYFGELSLKTGAPTIASVSAAADGAKVIRMDRGAFQRLLGPLDSLLALRKYTASGVEVVDADSFREDSLVGGSDGAVPEDFVFQKAVDELKLSDFDVTRDTLGEGAFGKVRRCVYKKTGRIFALKQMVKADIVEMGQVEHIMQETQILSSITHPFITNKFGALVTPTNLVLIMEFCPGGDMFDQLYKHKRFALADARIYTMQVLLPLEYLHAKGIVHRDLKLENLLVAQDGALKLTDFGFAKHIKYRSWTLCGTPEYLAPELILEKGHGKAVDYWALGVLCYEMINGYSPFEAEETLQTYQKILDGTVNYPSSLDSDAKDLISKLLQKDISRRLGNLLGGAKDIKNHAFFADVDWANPYHLRGSILPTAFQRASYEWVGAKNVVVETKKMKDEDQCLFKDFTV